MGLVSIEVNIETHTHQPCEKPGGIRFLKFSTLITRINTTKMFLRDNSNSHERKENNVE